MLLAEHSLESRSKVRLTQTNRSTKLEGPGHLGRPLALGEPHPKQCLILLVLEPPMQRLSLYLPLPSRDALIAVHSGC